MQIKEAFAAKGVPFWVESSTNQQFVILTQRQKEALAQGYYFEEEGAAEQLMKPWLQSTTFREAERQ